MAMPNKLAGMTGRNLTKQEADEVQQQYGVNFGAQGYEGGALGDSGFNAYHTGTGWGVQQAGGASPQAPAPGQPSAAPAPAAPAPAQATGPFAGMTDRNLTPQEAAAIQQQYGVNFGAQGYEGGALGDTGYNAYHTGTGWGIKQGGPAQDSTATTTMQPDGGIQAQGAPLADTGPPTTVPGAFQQALLNMLNDNQQAPTLDDPTLKSQMDAFAVSQTRAKERAREALAERRAASGQLSDLAGSGAFDRDLVGLEQAQGEAEGAYGSGLLANELQQRRGSLLAAAQLAGNQMNAESARELQKQLAEMDAEIRKLGIQQQGSLGSQELTLRDKLGSGQLNLGLLGTLLNNEQFGQQLASNNAQFSAGLNQQALLSMLGAL